MLTSRIQLLRVEGKIAIEQFISLSQNLNELADALGGMERIKKRQFHFLMRCSLNALSQDMCLHCRLA